MYLGKFDGRNLSLSARVARSDYYFGWGRGRPSPKTLPANGGSRLDTGLCRVSPAPIAWRAWRARIPKPFTPSAMGSPATRSSPCLRRLAPTHLDRNHRPGNRGWTGLLGPHGRDACMPFPKPTACLSNRSPPPSPKTARAISGRASTTADWRATATAASPSFRLRGVPGVRGCLFLDSSGRLWSGTSRGLIRIDDPAEERPRLVVYGPAQGLSSSDSAGSAKTAGGASMPPPAAALIVSSLNPGIWAAFSDYTTADGVAAGALDLALRDSQGNMWFSTPLGLSQFMPAADRPQSTPPVLVTGLSVGGVARPVSDLGESTIAGLRLPQNPLRIDYVGLGFQPGETFRYQYMLEGADRDWSAPTDQRSVIYARLAAGSYRFLVRAVAGNGVFSPQPASVAFTILPPVWRSWWFLLAFGTVIALLIYTVYRYRVAQLLAVANIRTRIATDLHDDIGASLSQIAILSEVAQREARNGALNGTPLTDIAGISRELVDSMSDIVWAINPDHDRLSNLVYRMRRFATDLLGAQGIALQFRSSVADHDLRIGLGARRQIYLIFKEAIHNLARHSGAAHADVEFDRSGDSLFLRVKDDGKGFDPSVRSDGHGLISIHKRAAAMGAKVEWKSAPGQGTTLFMTVRLEPVKNLSLLRGRITKSFR